MVEPSLTQKMVSEAFHRSQKDRRIAHIFLSFRSGNGYDTAAAYSKRAEVEKRLQKGENFSLVAKELSDDTSARTNGGDLGFITVFTLPYELENLVYNTPVGKYSGYIRSNSGLHIIKVIEERNAVGKMKLQQILIGLPPGVDEAGKKLLAKKADSVYKKLLAGADFSQMATALSDDFMTANNGGNMPDVGVGQYDPLFEKMVFSLKKDGEISKPFLSSHGWHIIKRVSAKPIIKDSTDKAYRSELEQKIVTDNRWRFSKDFIFKKVKDKPGFRKYSLEEDALWNFSDSALDRKPLDKGRAILPSTPVFAIGDSVFTASDWLNYAATYRYRNDGTGAKPWTQVMDEFIRATQIAYYKDHLEDYNEDFRNQMTEFKDGNLFFEIMQQQVWNRSQADSSALLGIYEKNKKNYLWKPSADAILFFCTDLATAREVYDKVKATPSSWNKVSEIYADKLVTDSSRYEWDQIPNLNKSVPRKGMFTSPVVNETDKTASFAYILQVYPNAMPRNYNDAKGLVIADYQAELEKKWEEDLMKKYPVKVDEAVLKRVINNY
jgi:peptidyl-prolyl cis-trans isomerase SurA